LYLTTVPASIWTPRSLDNPAYAVMRSANLVRAFPSVQRSWTTLIFSNTTLFSWSEGLASPFAVIAIVSANKVLVLSLSVLLKVISNCLVRYFDIDHQSSEVRALQNGQCQVCTNNPPDQQPDRLWSPDSGDKTREEDSPTTFFKSILWYVFRCLNGRPVVVSTWNSRGTTSPPF